MGLLHACFILAVVIKSPAYLLRPARLQMAIRAMVG